MKYYLLLALVLSLSACLKEPETFDSREQVEKEGILIDEYLEENQLEAETHTSGLRYIIHNEGTGEQATVNSTITINYEGFLLDETEFDSGDEVELVLARLIAGWQIGIPLIKSGGSISLYIPSPLAYGTRGSGSTIPGNTPIYFNIELLEVR